MRGRMKILGAVFLVGLCIVTVAVGCIALGLGYTRAQSAVGSRQSITELYALKGTIYDYRGNCITNAENCCYLLVDPRGFDRSKIGELARIGNMSMDALNEKLSGERTFVLCAEESPEHIQGVYCFDGKARYSGVATHLIGYLNGDGEGVAGLERSYNDFLSYFGGSKTVSFTADGRRNPMTGLGLTLSGDTDGKENGVITTLDLEMQKDLESAMDTYIDKGAAVVLDIRSGEIRALCSRPDFDPDRVEDYLQRTDGELVNRALQAQTVGSVFKTVLAIGAIEQKMDDFTCKCEGSITVGDRAFTCPTEGGHGQMSLESAFAESCNVYFIALGQMLGGTKISEIATRLGFGEEMEIATGLSAASGALPDLTGNSVKQLANYSLGQGTLTASPLQIARMMAVCGNGGYLTSPTVFQGYTVDGQTKNEEWVEYTKRVLSAETAEKVRGLCIATVQKGTGKNAKPYGSTAGGKTSSAQTGVFSSEGREVLNTYFAGFFPADKPEYAVAVFAEDGISGGKTCAPVFRAVAEGALLRKKD